MIRLLICDDSPEARAAVRTMLGEEGEVEIVGEAENGDEAVSVALAEDPDVVLMDVNMPVVDGVEATRRLRRLMPGVRIVAFAGSDDTEVIAAMIEAGANAYCVKGAPLWEFERAIAGQSDPLIRLAHGLAKTVNGGGAAEFVAREVADLTGAAFVATYLASPDVSLSLGGLAGPFPPTSLSSAPGVALRAFTEATFARAEARELAELWRLGCPCAEALAAPLLADGDALGALLVAMPPNIQLVADEELVSAVADLAAASLANFRRLALTYAEARRDALTGLANKRAFNEHLDKVFRRAVETNGEIAVVVLDIDDFKQINDREGHLAGDEVLTELSRVMQRALRSSEQVFRIGGEEFAIVIESDAAIAARVAERLRVATATRRRGRQLPTLSVGIASTRPPCADSKQLVQRADQALYRAKRAGKDRVVVDGAPPLAAVAPTRTAEPPVERAKPLRVLLVDDDESLRILLRTTFEVVDIEVDEAADAKSAERRIADARPDVLVLDVGMPGVDGFEFCRRLKARPETRAIGVIVLTGADSATRDDARAAGADMLLRKPFSPLELLGVVERLAGGLYEGPFESEVIRPPEEQLLLYAQDLRRLREIERGQRVLLQRAYRETVTALASALESKDTGTRAHSQRVQSYAVELAAAVRPDLLEDPSIEYGFLLHDVGKIGIPDRILQKRGPLTVEERRLMETHTMLGEQMLGEVALLQGEGLKVVRCHHERWDGHGYPDSLAADDIPLGARIFAVADTLDAITSPRPYRSPVSWDVAVETIVTESRRQFDPAVIEGFRRHGTRLRRIHYELGTVEREGAR
jgi:diguanylate cyclase (GGDEF)-like protein